LIPFVGSFFARLGEKEPTKKQSTMLPQARIAFSQVLVGSFHPMDEKNLLEKT
jgi:hypothetical protein